MDDIWLVLMAENNLKDFDAWGTLYKIFPENWDAEDYQTIACITQQLLAEKEDLFYLRRRRQASRKRAANRER